MGATKTDLFTKQQNDIATMAKAIAHPARVAILQYLVKELFNSFFKDVNPEGSCC